MEIWYQHDVTGSKEYLIFLFSEYLFPSKHSLNIFVQIQAFFTEIYQKTWVGVLFWTHSICSSVMIMVVLVKYHGKQENWVHFSTAFEIPVSVVWKGLHWLKIVVRISNSLIYKVTHNYQRCKKAFLGMLTDFQAGQRGEGEENWREKREEGSEKGNGEEMVPYSLVVFMVAVVAVVIVIVIQSRDLWW